MLLTQEEEHSQPFRQLSVEFLVRSIHFVHFIYPYMNPLPNFEYRAQMMIDNSKTFILFFGTPSFLFRIFCVRMTIAPTMEFLFMSQSFSLYPFI